MLYLEDYLEMIEHLPAELRDRFAEMREMDLSVQNRVDSLEDRQKAFFSNCRKLKSADRDEEFNKIKREYAKVIEDSSEKIQSAEESYNLVDRYLRKLDQELHKFKMELEADNRGITEILEKRSLEMDAPPASTAKENRLPKKHTGGRKNQTIAHPSSSSASSSSSLNMNLDRGAGSSKAPDHRKFFGDTGLGGFDTGLPSPGGSGLLTPGTATPSAAAAAAGSSAGTYPLQHMGAGGNAIAAAASQAIAATQQLVPGRRTSSLKASYEAINLGMQAHGFSIGRELAGAAQSALAATALNPGASGGDAAAAGPSSKGQKVSKRGGSQAEAGSSQSVLDVVSGSLLDDSLLPGTGLGGMGAGSPLGDDPLGGAGRSDDQEQWNFDPNEPRYCVCNQVSYGDMVACDNEECPYEWFHYPCVGITAPPKGKWFCPTCLARRKGRK